MRVAIVAESFLPQVNGVTNSVLRVMDHLRLRGHEVAVTTPGTAATPREYNGFPVTPQFSMGLPGYGQVRVAPTPSVSLERWLEEVDPDVVHLASPFSLGYKGALAAARLELPSIGLYQTEVPTYAARYGFTQVEPLLWRRVREIHSLCTLTLAPSSYTRESLLRHGVPRVHLWGRGVDSTLFHPAKRSAQLRGAWAPDGERVIGFVGRLAPEKQVDDLRVLADIPGARLVIVGDGPCRAELEALMPQAVFTGQLRGEELAAAYASFDVFVSPGEMETFNQTIQEAMASGLPAIAPAKGGPIDLIDSSHTGWLYEPGDLASLRRHAADLVGDDRKRAAFSQTARATVEGRTWTAVCDQLIDYYRDAIAGTRVGVS